MRLWSRPFSQQLLWGVLLILQQSSGVGGGRWGGSTAAAAAGAGCASVTPEWQRLAALVATAADCTVCFHLQLIHWCIQASLGYRWQFCDWIIFCLKGKENKGDMVDWWITLSFYSRKVSGLNPSQTYWRDFAYSPCIWLWPTVQKHANIWWLVTCLQNYLKLITIMITNTNKALRECRLTSPSYFPFQNKSAVIVLIRSHIVYSSTDHYQKSQNDVKISELYIHTIDQPTKQPNNQPTHQPTKSPKMITPPSLAEEILFSYLLLLLLYYYLNLYPWFTSYALAGTCSVFKSSICVNKHN